MSQYYRNHPDEPISHDWVSSPNTRKISALAAPKPQGDSGLVSNGNVDRATISDPPELRSDNKR